MIEIDELLIRDMVIKGRRLDGRTALQYRNVKMETGVVGSAEGSCRVRLGETEVIAGVKMGVAAPYPDTPDEGVLTVNAEFVPFASPEFEAGPPGEEAIELARVVDRAIRESKCIDFPKLCLEPRKFVWMVFVDIDVINDDGNLIDASCLAAVAALATARMPELQKSEDSYRAKPGTKAGPLHAAGLPVSTTFAKFGSVIIADPALPEIKAMEARLTVGTIDRDGGIKLCSMQKGGKSGFTPEELEKLVQLAVEKGGELRKLLMEAVGK